MLANTVHACPAEVWQTRLWPVHGADPAMSAFWNVVFHTLFWLDYYLEGTPEGFAPPAPFELNELDPAGVMPPRVYTPAELLAYLAHGRAKCISRLSALDATTASQQSGFRWLPCSYLEVQMYNMRHVQEHAAQLSMQLGQSAGFEAPWVKFGKS